MHTARHDTDSTVLSCLTGGVNRARDARQAFDWTVERRTYGPRSGGAETVRRAGDLVGLVAGGTAVPVLHGDVEAQTQRTVEEPTLGARRCHHQPQQSPCQ